MVEEKQNKQSGKRKGETFAKIVFVFAKFSWFFGIIIALAVLFSLYRIVIQPQYQKIFAKQEQIRTANLEGEKGKLQVYLNSLERFITLTDAITKEDKNNLNKILQDVPDELVLEIQFDSLMEKYDTQESSVTLGEPVFFDAENGEAPEEAREDRERIVNLSAFFDEQEEPVADPSPNTTLPQIITGEIPVTISATFIDYFTAKDFLRDVEQLVPLVEVQTLSITVDSSEEEDADEELIEPEDIIDPEDEVVELPSSGMTTILISGVLKISKIK